MKKPMLVSFGQFEKLFEGKNPEKIRQNINKGLFGKDEIISQDGFPLKDEDIQAIIDADPNPQKKYVNWMIGLFRKTNKSVFLEDLYKATEYLTVYDRAKKVGAITDERLKNIANISSLPDLFDIIEPFMEDEVQLRPQSRQLGNTPVEGQYELLFYSSEWDVVIPRTYDASRHWGSGTNWCTVGNKSYYDNYTKDGPLYIFRHVTDSDLRFQLHLASGQFMDKKDRPYSPDKFFADYPELKDALTNAWKKNKTLLEEETKNPLDNVISRNNDNWNIFINMIVKSGFDLNYEDKNGDNVLIIASKKLDKDLIQFLCDNGADASKPNKNGVTAVLTAISTTPSSLRDRLSLAEVDMKTLDIIQLLFSYGADASGRSANGTGSSVSEAILQNKVKTALYLVDKPGYDPNATDTRSGAVKNLSMYLPRLPVTVEGSDSSMSYKEAQFFIETLIEKGLDINGTNTDTSLGTPLSFLSRFATLCSRDPKALDSILFIAKILLENGADPWVQNETYGQVTLPIEDPYGKPKNPKMVQLLTSYMQKLKPGQPIPQVEVE